MTAEIKPHARVRVSVYRRGFHQRNFYASVIGWTKNGLVRVLEDGKRDAHNYSSDNVKLIKQ